MLAFFQEYINDKDHVHMNATRWETLTGFVKYLGRTGKCVVDETEKGWFVTWIDRDPETIARQEALAKKGKLDKDDAERMAEFIEKQVSRAKEAGEVSSADPEYSEFVRQNEEDKLQLELKMTDKSASKPKELPNKKSVFKSVPGSSPAVGDKRKEEDGKKRKKSALEEIMEEEERRKSQKKLESRDTGKEHNRHNVKSYWLMKNIVVKIVTKSLGDEYYKQKGYVKEVVDRYAAVVVLLDSKSKVKLDQEHLETVIPALGKAVLIVNGTHRGHEGTLKYIDVDNFCASLKLDDGTKVILPYEHFCKIHMREK